MAYQDNSVISLAEVVDINKKVHTLRLMSIQSLQNISFTQSHGGDDDDPIVPPN